MQTKDLTGIAIRGHIKIHDPETGEVYHNKTNAIHYENMSIGIAQSMINGGQGFVYQMAFGNGGTSIDPTGIITYLTPNTSGTNASLYNQTYAKVVDPNSSTNTDPTRNFTEVRHVHVCWITANHQGKLHMTPQQMVQPHMFLMNWGYKVIVHQDKVYY